MFPPLNEQLDVIKSGVAEMLPENELVLKIERSIKTNKPMLIKLGCDPSRPDLHIGHAVVLNKLRQFQELGHEVVFIIGDFTAMIGDPTGKSKTRPALTIEETKINGQSYLDQVGKIVDVAKARIVYNSDWLSKMTFADVIKMSAQYTVSQMLEREDFHKRFNEESPISLHEFMYPLAQAMDSVHLKNDIEIGGTDQKFNFLVARELQRSYGVEPQCILTMPILEGTDGVEKMSKSLDNYIAITDTPREMFGKTMSIPDTMIARYLQYGAFASAQEVEAMKQGLADGTAHPRHAKVSVAMKIVARYHGEAAGQAAFEEFERMFVKKDVPDVIEETTIEITNPASVTDVLAATALAPSKSEARRLIQGGGVSIDGEKVTDINATVDLTTKRLFKVGKRKFLYVSI
ncbi:MAG: tyrosine--tRNA ligase [Candidatus Kapaibacterium sp.]|nr:tyrosine--tRNA ligase [Bacteroidota bacterium]